jgi:hypothetical protein
VQGEQTKEGHRRRCRPAAQPLAAAAWCSLLLVVKVCACMQASIHEGWANTHPSGHMETVQRSPQGKSGLQGAARRCWLDPPPCQRQHPNTQHPATQRPATHRWASPPRLASCRRCCHRTLQPWASPRQRSGTPRHPSAVHGLPAGTRRPQPARKAGRQARGQVGRWAGGWVGVSRRQWRIVKARSPWERARVDCLACCVSASHAPSFQASWQQGLSSRRGRATNLPCSLQRARHLALQKQPGGSGVSRGDRTSHSRTPASRDAPLPGGPSQGGLLQPAMHGQAAYCCTASRATDVLLRPHLREVDRGLQRAACLTRQDDLHSRTSGGGFMRIGMGSRHCGTAVAVLLLEVAASLQHYAVPSPTMQ